MVLQRYGQGPEDQLALEANGDYTREIGYIRIANYTVNVSQSSSFDNLLNNIWYQPEEIFPVDGTPEERQHAFWVPVDPLYYNLSQNLEVILLLTSSLSSILNNKKSPFWVTLYQSDYQPNWVPL